MPSPEELAANKRRGLIQMAKLIPNSAFLLLTFQRRLIKLAGARRVLSSSTAGERTRLACSIRRLAE